MIIEERKVAIGAQQVDLVIKRHPRAKSIRLRMDKVDPKVFLTLPRRASVKSGLAFFDKSHAWIAKHLVTTKPASFFKNGGTVPFLGEELLIHHTESKTPRIDLKDQMLHVHGCIENLHADIILWLKKKAHDFMHDTSHKHAKQLNVPINKIRVKDLKSRWGSCSSAKNLSYSWRVIMAPRFVAEYLCIHEVTHLVEMNHSPRFWDLVAGMSPDFKDAKKWLRTQGRQLMAY